MSISLSSLLGTTNPAQIAKAWVNFNGTLATPITPRDNFNVSSITKNGTGIFTLNFPSGVFTNTSYCVAGSVGNNAIANNWNGFNTADADVARTTTALRINTWYGSQSADRTLQSYAYTEIVVFGN